MLELKDTANDAVLRVAKADEQPKRLSSAAEAMSGIVQIIGDITGQINLWRSTPRSSSPRARAKPVGICRRGIRGQEANQAKQATDKITEEIGSLNGISGDVVTALKSIRQAIQSAAAVEQQSTVTRRNVDQHATRRGRGRKHRTASGAAVRCLLSENARVVVIAMSVRETP